MLNHVTMCCTSDVIFRKEAKVFVAYLRSDFERQAQCLESSFSSNIKKSSASLRKFCSKSILWRRRGDFPRRNDCIFSTTFFVMKIKVSLHTSEVTSKDKITILKVY